MSGVFSTLELVLNALFLFVGLYVYVSLSKQIGSRPTASEESDKRFGLPEFVLAFLLMLLLLANLVPGSGTPQVDSHSLIIGILLTGALVFVIVALLVFRGFNMDTLGGFSKIRVARAFTIGAILLIAAYPLVSLADAITQHFLDGSGSKQSIVELFSESHSIRQRMLVIAMAVMIAPIAEEFIFRFFLYGVLRRYAGRVIALTISAVLFGAAHTHLPSFAPLVVLGVCFTIAYEWSGSILVSMAMHSLFNAFQLVLLPQ